MRYLSSFSLSPHEVKNPNIYPYNVFAKKRERVLLFDRITILYGNNASGKSTMLNIIANKLNLEGAEKTELEERKEQQLGPIPRDFFKKYVNECGFSMGEDEDGVPLYQIPEKSRYIKSEDILYEIKKIQQEQILREGYVCERIRRGMATDKIDQLRRSSEMNKQIGYIRFSQEKYSNGETTLQMLDEYIEPDALYLLDEPEVSLSPQNQIRLAVILNNAARYLGCQFIIATHSPFLLGTLDARIYNLDTRDLEVAKWTELGNVRCFYEFFELHREEFLTE